MTRILWIPVGGTLLALLAVFVFGRPRDVHDEHGDDAGPDVSNARPGKDLLDPPTDDEPPPADDERANETGENEPPSRPPVEYHLRLEADGSFMNLETLRRYADVKELKDQLAPDKRVRNRILLSNGEDVVEADLVGALRKLVDTFDVRKLYR